MKLSALSTQTTRTQRAKLNIYGGLLVQVVTIICGLVVPRLLLSAFGSDAYGATASIAQFLSYITLLEGGIGGVARAALYKPLAENNWEQVSRILNEIKYFFRVIGVIFIAYTLVIACTFKSISHFAYYDWLSTFLLVIVISFSTLAQYFIGISYYLLLHSAQRGYIQKLISTAGIFLNTLLVVVLVYFRCGLITVKLVSALVFLLQPLALYGYVRTHFPLVKTREKDTKALSQKWHGLSQHLAYFLHNNTDITILTVFTTLPLVSVYAIYNMIVTQIQNLTLSFTQGMEALFGELLAKKELAALHKTFDYYETLISVCALPLFTTTLVMIVPFVRLYTHGVTDAPYTQPVFAALLVLATLLHCLRMPYHTLTIAAGHFKQTQGAAYGEAVLNITLSILLVWRFGLIGVAVGTLVAVGFRFIYYIGYLGREIFRRDIRHAVKRLMVNAAILVVSGYAGYLILTHYAAGSYIQWALLSGAVAVVSGVVTLIGNTVFYAPVMRGLLRQVKRL